VSTAAIRRYWTAVVEDGCILCGGPAEIAHCHGGSIAEKLQEPKAKGKKLPYMDWLVLPLCPHHGRAEYETGLDRNVDEWETIYGDQTKWLDAVKRRTGIDPWEMARGLMKPKPARRG
jgi:hypothetical protein